MNQDFFNKLQFDLSGIGGWLVVLGVIWLLGAIGLGWLVKSFLILIGLIAIAPIIGFYIFRWWLQRNLIQDSCPVCSYEFTALNRTRCQCPNCGEPIQVEQKQFRRFTPSGTIDIDAVEVSAKQIED